MRPPLLCLLAALGLAGCKGLWSRPVEPFEPGPPRVLKNRALLGSRKLTVQRQWTERFRFDTAIVDDSGAVVFSLDGDCVAVVKDIGNIYHDPQQRYEEWNDGISALPKNCYIHSSTQGFIYDPDTGHIAPVPPGGELIMVRELWNHKPGTVETRPSLLVWREQRGEETHSVVLLPDLGVAFEGLVDLTWEHRGPEFLGPLRVRDPRFRSMRFLSFAHRLEAGWGGFIWLDELSHKSYEGMAGHPIDWVGDPVVPGPNNIPGRLSSREDTMMLCELWATNLVEHIYEGHRAELEEQRRLAELERQRLAAEKARRAEARLPAEKELAVELAALEERAWELSLEFRDAEAVTLFTAFLDRALARLDGLAPEESPLVVAAMHAKVGAQANLAGAWLQDSVDKPPADVGAALHEAQLVRFHEHCPDAEEAEVHVWLLEMVRYVSATSDSGYDSFVARVERDAPASLDFHLSAMQERRREYLLRQRVERSGWTYTPPAPTWFEQFAGFFTAGASTDLPLPGPSSGPSPSSGSSYTPNTGPGEFQIWVAQEQWKSRVQEIQKTYSNRYNYQNRYDY